MENSRRFYVYLGLCTLTILSLGLGGLYFGNLKLKPSIQTYQTIEIQEQEYILIDSVHTINAPYDVVEFDSLQLFEQIEYNLSISLVSPHSCDFNITIIDPDLSLYEIKNQTIEKGLPENEYKSFSFGTAISGNYTVIFSFITENNLNVYLYFSAIKGCFETKIEEYDINDLIFYRITKFMESSPYIEHNIWLNTNANYHFFIALVTPLSYEGILIPINYSIEDPMGIEFKIYNPLNLSFNNQLESFIFQTAHSGIHIIKLRANLNISLNLGYFSIRSLKESGHTNDPQPFPSTNPSSQFFITMDIFIVFIVVILIILISLFYLVKRHQRIKSKEI